MTTRLLQTKERNMSIQTIRRTAYVLGLLLTGSLLTASDLYAHCDGLDGPVVAAGERALETGDVRHALVWVLEDDEAEVRHAFDHASEVRALSDEARELADRHFFETLVRVHRAGEGAPYTGLKPAGRDLGPAIPAADRALELESVAELEEILLHAVRDGLLDRFQAAGAAAGYAGNDVEAGRAFVAAYVPFMHYVEALYEIAAGHGHGEEAGSDTAEPGHE